MGSEREMTCNVATYGALMGSGEIDRDSPVPPYLQVAAILRSRIESGELPPKTRLPSIVGLVQEYGIARTTAGKALSLLVEEGYAERVTGWGHFVRER